jgi:hypothetical protein
VQSIVGKLKQKFWLDSVGSFKSNITYDYPVLEILDSLYQKLTLKIEIK